jgi:hypothetical protein
MAEEMYGKEEEEMEDIINKRVKLDEGKVLKKPVDVPIYLRTQEESLNYTN